MPCTRSVLFVIMTMNFLHSAYSNLQGTVGNPGTKKNVKCVVNPLKEENVSNHPADIAKADAKTRRISIMKNVAVGANFNYEACGSNSEMILHWGIHKHGKVPPKTLLARVEISDTFCSVGFTLEFRASRYHGRLTVEYDIPSKCVLWTLSNVTKEDENVFVAAVRDDLSQGKGFVPRAPVFLRVSTEAAKPLLTPPPSQTTAVKTKGLSTPPPTKTLTSPSTTPSSIPATEFAPFPVWYPLLLCGIFIVFFVVLVYKFDNRLEKKSANEASGSGEASEEVTQEEEIVNGTRTERDPQSSDEARDIKTEVEAPQPGSEPTKKIKSYAGQTVTKRKNKP